MPLLKHLFAMLTDLCCTWDRRYLSSVPGCTNRSYEYFLW